MKTPFMLSVALLALAAPVMAQDVTPAIDPGFAATGAANREALEREARRSSGGQQVRRSGAGARRAAVRPGAERRRAARRALRAERRGW